MGLFLPLCKEMLVSFPLVASQEKQVVRMWSAKKEFQISPYEKHIINKYHQMRHISSLTNIIRHQVRRPCTVSRQGWGCGHHWIPCAAPWSNHPLLWDANICNLVTKTFIYGSLRSCAPANIQNLTRSINVVRKVQIRLTYGSCLIVNTCFLQGK